MAKTQHNAHLNQWRMQLLAVKIAKQVSAGADRGLNAARVFLTGRVKEAVSVPAPRKAVRAASVNGKKGGILYYRATTPATAGAAPRKLSSRLRTGITSKMLTPKTAVMGVRARTNPTRKWPAGYNYPRHLEETDHPFMAVTVNKWKRQAAMICGGYIRLR